MDKKALQSYAVWAKINLENQIEVQLKTLGINSERDIKTARKVGDRTIIDGDSNSYSGDLKEKRDQIIRLVQEDGYKQVIEEFAYTWFNRIVALRFMEVHDFLPHGFRVLSSRTGGFEPEIMKNLNFVKDDLKLDLSVISPLMEQGKIDEAYRYVLFRQCNVLSGILPMLFSTDQSYLELLLPKALLKGETFITKLLEIGEADFLNDVEVIGWLYQFYISQKKDEVFASKATITKDTLPAVTQLFTPDWIVRYMAENSVGRIWLEGYPNSALKNDMKYYVEDAEQEPEVQRKLDEVKYKNVNPENIKIIEPCCGSGHILVYVFDLLYKMYEEKGYPAREIPTLILKKNLTGLDVDKRAAQLASFSLVMKARSANSRFFNDVYYVIPEVFDIWDSRALFHSDYLNQIRETKLLNNQQIKEIEWLTESFRYGKTIGSLLKIEESKLPSIEKSIELLSNNAVINIFNSNFLNEGIACLRRLVKQAYVLSKKYDVMITNPPYIGITSFEAPVKEYASKFYENSKADMFAMFMETSFVKPNGYTAIINMQSWMFLSSFEKFRLSHLKHNCFLNILHLGPHAFESIGGEVVQTVSFVEKNYYIENYKTSIVRLVDYEALDKQSHLDDPDKLYVTSFDKYFKIPGVPCAYWIENSLLNVFNNHHNIYDYSISPSQNVTGNNEKYLRYFWEVNGRDVCVNDKWIFYAKGGGYRKWYGNLIDIINWTPKARKHYAEGHACQIIRPEYWYKKGITWSLICTDVPSFRVMPEGATFDKGGSTVLIDEKYYHYIMALLNSKVAYQIVKIFNPTIHYQVRDIRNIPFVTSNYFDEISSLGEECIDISKRDWDRFEISWDFKRHPLLRNSKFISSALNDFNNESNYDFKKLKDNEERINELFISIYGLSDILDMTVENESLSIRTASAEREIKSLISYLIGVEMGRYSLDVEGLVYAGGEWNPMKYVTHQPDDDGIIPVYTQLGMADGLTARIIKLIKKIYGEDTYKDNIDFIADALGKKSSESSEETLNRYLNDEFYADHLKTYQKRPIYWMFSSGKNNAFKCLVYLHRYNEDTLARINSKYFLNESARLNAEVNDTTTQLEAADVREKLRLDKLYKVLTAKQKEMLEYGWVLDHKANEYIPLDLDDGVKFNYTKFQGIEIVNDNGAKVKKDLLVPIK